MGHLKVVKCRHFNSQEVVSHVTGVVLGRQKVFTMHPFKVVAVTVVVLVVSRQSSISLRLLLLKFHNMRINFLIRNSHINGVHYLDCFPNRIPNGRAP